MSRTSFAFGVLMMVWSIFAFGKDYPDALLEQADGFADISLSIAKTTALPDGGIRVYARGLLKGKKVGFAVELLPNWKKNQIENTEQHFYWGGGRFIRTGPETDAFLTVLASLYGQGDTPRKARGVVEAEVVGLANDPQLIPSEPTRMKFFFNSNGEEDMYSEVFINTDVRNSILQFHEKDPEYRKPLIFSLSE